jgi:D-beta-D-heptose 7-phosphate kinase/D-beta-D-heptose 1-phosphate adenosyltransferase
MKIKKLHTLGGLRKKLKALRAGKRRVVFTNGCFDILHAGHVRYLAAAKKLGDALIVGLNSDSSVRRIKGKERPIVPEAERAEVLSGLESVDFIVIFDEPTPIKLIETLRPDVLVKGADWKRGEIVGEKVVLSLGGRVKRITLVKGKSTTNIIKKILGEKIP